MRVATVTTIGKMRGIKCPTIVIWTQGSVLKKEWIARHLGLFRYNLWWWYFALFFCCQTGQCVPEISLKTKLSLSSENLVKISRSPESTSGTVLIIITTPKKNKRIGLVFYSKIGTYGQGKKMDNKVRCIQKPNWTANILMRTLIG